MSSRSKTTERLADREYRDAYVRALAGVNLPMQIRALRKQHRLTQRQLAERTGMKQARISALETSSGDVPNLNTLMRLAAAFDVGMMVWFAPFSELIERDERFQPDTFGVPSYEDDSRLNRLTAEENASWANDFGTRFELVTKPGAQRQTAAFAGPTQDISVGVEEINGQKDFGTEGSTN